MRRGGQVYLNGHYLGDLTGANEQDSTTVFNIPYLTWVLPGRNIVQILVDVANPGNPTMVRLAQERPSSSRDDRCAFSATCRSVSTDKVAYPWPNGHGNHRGRYHATISKGCASKATSTTLRV